MEIHLSKPGGRREGPFTLDQIRHDLAARKYSDADYWAWHEGLTEWVPLYALPGIGPGGGPLKPEPKTPSPRAAASAPSSAAPTADRIIQAPAAPVPEPDEERASVSNKLPSGMPVSALEQVFAFTTGDGPAAWQSPTVNRMLKEIVGQELSVFRESVPRDVVGSCSIGDLLKSDGSISDAVWHVMAIRRPTLIQQARERLYRVCVRTFRIESDTIVALILFYNKQKL